MAGQRSINQVKGLPVVKDVGFQKVAGRFRPVNHLRRIVDAAAAAGFGSGDTRLGLCAGEARKTGTVSVADPATRNLGVDLTRQRNEKI